MLLWGFLDEGMLWYISDIRPTLFIPNLLQRGLLWPSHLIFNPKVASFGSCCKTSTADHRNVRSQVLPSMQDLHSCQKQLLLCLSAHFCGQPLGVSQINQFNCQKASLASGTKNLCFPVDATERLAPICSSGASHYVVVAPPV